MNIHEDGEFYVCISHQVVVPCEYEGQHLISNWKSDVKRILEIMEAKNGNES